MKKTDTAFFLDIVIDESWRRFNEAYDKQDVSSLVLFSDLLIRQGKNSREVLKRLNKALDWEIDDETRKQIAALVDQATNSLTRVIKELESRVADFFAKGIGPAYWSLSPSTVLVRGTMPTPDISRYRVGDRPILTLEFPRPSYCLVVWSGTNEIKLVYPRQPIDLRIIRKNRTELTLPQETPPPGQRVLYVVVSRKPIIKSIPMDFSRVSLADALLGSLFETYHPDLSVARIDYVTHH